MTERANCVEEDGMSDLENRMSESRTLEYKEDLTKSYLKTVSAFANYDGGSIIFGVRNALKITPYKSVFKPSDSIVPFTNFSKVCQIDVIHLLV